MDQRPEITVREATLTDLDALVPLFDAYRQFYRKPEDLALARRFLEERLQHRECIIFILNDLFVAPAARRGGVGGLLLRAAASFGREAGAVRLTLSTEVTNEVAQALYEANSWKRQT